MTDVVAVLSRIIEAAIWPPASQHGLTRELSVHAAIAVLDAGFAESPPRAVHVVWLRLGPDHAGNPTAVVRTTKAVAAGDEVVVTESAYMPGVRLPVVDAIRRRAMHSAAAGAELRVQ